MTKDGKSLTRWRLILGRYAQDRINQPLSGIDLRREAALDYLYRREYRQRGIRDEGNSSERAGSLDASQLNIPSWLAEVRELFPRETVEIIEKHALDRYGLTELVTDPEVLEKLTPNMDLLKMILTFRGMMQGEVLKVARRIVREIVEEIKRRLTDDIRQVLSGRLNRFQHSPLKVMQNFDWRNTIRRNLKNYDLEKQRLIVDEIRFFSRVNRHLPWEVIICIDQSGSMASSVIHSAVMAGILAGLPALKISIVVFDTSIVDLSDHADDPVEILMSVQLGGGTDIGQALKYCEGLVHNPHRTALILVSDFYEGASVESLSRVV
jgi:uncharacterized protein with von Willebrand factor type A (vWA) domain